MFGTSVLFHAVGESINLCVYVSIRLAQVRPPWIALISAILIHVSIMPCVLSAVRQHT